MPERIEFIYDRGGIIGFAYSETIEFLRADSARKPADRTPEGGIRRRSMGLSDFHNIIHGDWLPARRYTNVSEGGLSR